MNNWYLWAAVVFRVDRIAGVEAISCPGADPGSPITSSSHVFTNPESTKSGFNHEICLFCSVINRF